MSDTDIDPYYKLKGLAKLVFSHITMWVIGNIIRKSIRPF